MRTEAALALATAISASGIRALFDDQIVAVEREARAGAFAAVAAAAQRSHDAVCAGTFDGADLDCKLRLDRLELGAILAQLRGSAPEALLEDESPLGHGTPVPDEATLPSGDARVAAL